MSGREIIQEALEASNRSGSLSPRAADWLITRMSRAGYRIIGPGELDPVTVERCAEIARAAHISHAPGLDGYNIDVATALRSLTEAKP